MEFNNEITRLITAVPSQIGTYNGRQLKEAILKSEGRVIMGQNYVGNPIPHPGLTNCELQFAFGADMVLINGFNFENPESEQGMQGMTLKKLKELCSNRPIGIYMSCPSEEDTSLSDPSYIDSLSGMLFTPERVNKAVELGASFIVLGGNPGTGTSIQDVVRATKQARLVAGDDLLIFAGKWEDGIQEKVLGDPLAEYDTKQVIKDLIDAGADVIDFPAPGSRSGITVERIRELIEFTHRYKPGTLAMSFLNSNVEFADAETIRHITLMMKQTGCDIHAIGDGGFGGGTWPENIYQMSLTLLGRTYTWMKMARPNR